MLYLCFKCNYIFEGEKINHIRSSNKTDVYNEVNLYENELEEHNHPAGPKPKNTDIPIKISWKYACYGCLVKYKKE